MIQAAAIAAGLIITAPQGEVAAPTPQAPSELLTLPRASGQIWGRQYRPRPGEGCSIGAHNSYAAMDGNGVVYLYMSRSEQLRRFGRLQDIYAPGDIGYALASGYATEGFLCGGGSVEIGGP